MIEVQEQRESLTDKTHRRKAHCHRADQNTEQDNYHDGEKQGAR